MPAFVRALLLGVLALLGASAAAQIEVTDVQELKGHWLVGVQAPNARQRLLVIDAVEPDGPGAWRLALRYSFAENRPKPIEPGRLEKTADGYRLRYVTGRESELVADYTRSGVFQGTFTPASGNTWPVVVSPLTDEEAAELQQELRQRRAQSAGKLGPVRPQSRVELIYLESTNYSCPFCRAWEKDYIATGKLRDSPEGKGLVITRVGTRRYIADMFLPENLRPYRAELEAKAKNLFRATPSFIVMVDDRPVSWGVGLSGWDNRVHPALQRIAAAKAGQR